MNKYFIINLLSKYQYAQRNIPQTSTINLHNSESHPTNPRKPRTNINLPAPLEEKNCNSK